MRPRAPCFVILSEAKDLTGRPHRAPGLGRSGGEILRFAQDDIGRAGIGWAVTAPHAHAAATTAKRSLMVLGLATADLLFVSTTVSQMSGVDSL